MRGVAREEHAPFAEPVRHGGARPEVRGPQHLGYLVRGQMGADADQLPYARGRGVRLALRELAHDLEVVGPRQRTDGEVAGAAAREDMPVEAVERGDADIGDQHRGRVDALAGHRYGEDGADRAAAAVRRDHVGRADRRWSCRRRPCGELGRHSVRVLAEPRQGRTESDSARELRQARVQDLLGAPLREQPRLAVRRGVRGPGALEHVVLPLAAAVLPDHADRSLAARGEDRVHDAEVVEDLHRAGLDALAA